MASDVDPPKAAPMTTYIGHKNSTVKSVTCIVCEQTYYRSDSNNKFKLGARYISFAIGVCHDHGEICKSLKIDNPVTSINDVVFGSHDNIFVKSDHKGFESIKYMIPYPDHYPLLLSIPIKQIESDVIHKQQTQINYKQLISNVSIESWLDIYNNDEIDGAMENFVSRIKNVIKICTTRVKNKNKGERKPWMNKALLREIKIKENLYNSLSIGFSKEKKEDITTAAEIYKLK